MYFEQFYLGCLAHASYMLGSEGEAVVVDPQRDVDLYLKAAEEHGLTIRHIFETHLHADFVSGHKELAARTGAQIYFGAKAGVTFATCAGSRWLRVAFRQGANQRPGNSGTHSGEYLPAGHRRGEAAKPWAVLTGDTLFLGDVGRPDLSRTHTPEQLAGMLYDSLHNKLLKLPDEVLVYPGSRRGFALRPQHAGRALLHDRHRASDQLRPADSKPRRVRETVDQQSACASRLFSAGCRDQSRRRPAALRPAGTQSSFARGAESHVGGRRDRAGYPAAGDQFAAGHVPGSVNIALSGQFATWAGTILGLSSRPVLIADSPDQLAEARLRLARVGIEAERGYLEGGVAGWKDAGFDLAHLSEISVKICSSSLSEDKIRVLDVRREPEWMAGHIDGADWWPLDRFRVSPPEVDLDSSAGGSLPERISQHDCLQSSATCGLQECRERQRRILRLATSATASRNRHSRGSPPEVSEIKGAPPSFAHFAKRWER